MIQAIGEISMQQFLRPNFNTDALAKDPEALKTHMVREQRPVEKSDGSQKADINLQSRDNMKSRNNLENGK